jgi:hypothetical protein
LVIGLIELLQHVAGSNSNNFTDLHALELTTAHAIFSQSAVSSLAVAFKGIPTISFSSIVAGCLPSHSYSTHARDFLKFSTEKVQNQSQNYVTTTVSRSVSLGIKPPSGAEVRFLLLPDRCGFVLSD